jgi:acetylglutamate kinase
VIKASRRAPVKVEISAEDAAASPAAANMTPCEDEGFQMVDYGFVGDVKAESVNAGFIYSLLERGIVPVFNAINHDGEGNLLNTNADTIAGETAKALASFFDVTLIYCFEKAGVLLSEDDDESVIPHIDEASFKELVEKGVIQGGMIPKIENSLAAVRQGVGRVIITKADAIDGTKGTKITC